MQPRECPTRRRARALVLALASALPVACATQAPFPSEPPPVVAARSLDAFALAAAWRDAGLAVPSNDADWTLDHWTVAAWSLRPEVALARADLDVARADAAIALLHPAPTLSLVPEFATNAATGTSPWTVAVALAALIDTPAKRRARTDSADAAVRAAWWNVADAYWRVRSDVRRHALAWVLASRAAALADEEAALRDEMAAIVRKRVEVGYADRATLARANAAAQVARATALGNRAAEREARAALAGSIGIAPAALGERGVAGLDAGLGALLRRDVAADREAAVLNRTDVARALADYATADAALRAALAQRRPAVTLAPGYTYDQGQRKLVLGVSLELMPGKRADAQVARAEASRRAAGARLLEAQSNALASAEQANAAFGELAAASESLDAAAAAQEAALASVRSRFAAGEADRSELVQAELDANAQAAAQLDLARRAWTALGTLEDATQRPIWPASQLAAPASAAPPDRTPAEPAR